MAFDIEFNGEGKKTLLNLKDDEKICFFYLELQH
jgi:hypothetical protein